MPKFVVRKGHDAFIYYETVVDAEAPAEARRLAGSPRYKGEWFATGAVAEFDHYDIDEDEGARPLEDGEVVEAVLTLGVTAQERDAVLTSLRLLQIALASGHLAPMLRDIFTNADTHPGLDVEAIDALCARVNT